MQGNYAIVWFNLQDSSSSQCAEVGRECQEKSSRGFSFIHLLSGRKQEEEEKYFGGNKNGEIRFTRMCSYMMTVTVMCVAKVNKLPISPYDVHNFFIGMYY